MKFLGLLAAVVLLSVSVAAQTAVFLTNTAPQQIIQSSLSATTTPVPVTLTGIDAGAPLFGIDFRPRTQEVYGVGSNGAVYIIGLTSGRAVRLGVIGAACSARIVAGDVYSMDFNPVADAIRIVSKAGVNLRITGVADRSFTCNIDGSLSYASDSTTPQAVGVAYTNSLASTTTTAEYIIDARTNSLARVDPPNNGNTTTIGNLNFVVAFSSPFDILTVGTTNTAYAVISANLYSVELTTGAATLVRNLGTPGQNVIGLTIIPSGVTPVDPTPSATTSASTTGSVTSGVSSAVATGVSSGVTSNSTAGNTLTTSGTSGLPTTAGSTSTTSAASSVAVSFFLLVSCLYVLL